MRARLTMVIDRHENRPDAKRAAAYGVRCGQYGYLVEATLDGGVRSQSELIEDAAGAADVFEDLRGRTMVQRISIIAAHTGEVLIDFPSRICVTDAFTAEFGAMMVDIASWERRRLSWTRNRRRRPQGTIGAMRVWVLL